LHIAIIYSIEGTMLKFSCLLLIPFIFGSLLGCAAKSSSPSQSVLPATLLVFTGGGTDGVFDPSLSFDPVAKTLWMSYSALNPSPLWPTQNTRALSTRIAFSNDHGATFADSGIVVNQINDVTLPLAAPNNAGTWMQEVSSLVYDSSAGASEKWRLFAHHYLMINGTPHQEHSWISFKKAASPQALAGATEFKLFAGAGYDTSNNSLGGSSGSPVGGAPLITLSALFSGLASCVGFTEPGAMATPSALYLSLTCKEVPSGVAQSRVILLRCAQPCDPLQSSSWALIGTLFSHANAVSAGYKDFDGASLYQQNGSYFMLVSPTSDQPVADAYNGCLVYQFSNIDLGQMQPTMSVYGTANSFNGACTFNENATGSGILYSEINTSSGHVQGRIYQSHIY
jgi:hypothetical protein